MKPVCFSPSMRSNSKRCSINMLCHQTCSNARLAALEGCNSRGILKEAGQGRLCMHVADRDGGTPIAIASATGALDALEELHVGG